MPFTETGKEKEKREAYYKANKERGIRAEQERDYKMFGTTEQNIPVVDEMGNTITGGSIGRPEKTAKERLKQITEAYGATGMKKGGKVSSASKRADGIAIRGKTRA